METGGLDDHARSAQPGLIEHGVGPRPLVDRDQPRDDRWLPVRGATRVRKSDPCEPHHERD